MSVKLTGKESRFIDQYLVDLNQTQAAIRAGYSAKTAGVISCEMMTKPHIQDAIAAKAAPITEALDISIDRTLRELAKIGYLDIEKENDKNIRVSDKIRALELLGKYQKLFTDKIEHTGKDGAALVEYDVAEAAKRIAFALQKAVTTRATPSASEFLCDPK